VAVLYLEGEIVDGEGSASNIGGERFATYLRYLASDKSVKALVVRVNSPGGSAFASEVIQHEISALRKTGRPVVISMGNYAASGGYWVTTSSDYIYAEPTTITGSIGVFGLFFNVQGLADTVGITTDTEKIGNYSDFDTVFRPKSDPELKIAQDQVNDIYGKFVDRVAKSRKMDPAVVEQNAQGRVWTGKDALDIHLVDKMGGLDDAIADAAKRAELSSGSYSIAEYPRPLKLAEKLILALQGFKEPVMTVDPFANILSTQTVRKGNPLVKATDDFRKQISSLNNFNDPMGFYARLPMGMELK
jgi:protease-4